MKWITDLNRSPDNMKFLEENVGKKILDIGIGNDCLDMTPKQKSTNGTTSNLKALAQQNNQQNENSTYRMGREIL